MGDELKKLADVLSAEVLEGGNFEGIETVDDLANQFTTISSPDAWRSGIDEDTLKHESLKEVNTIGDLVKRLSEAPQALVLPENAEGYKLPEGFAHKDIAQFAFENKLTQDHLDKLIEYSVKKTESFNTDFNDKKKVKAEELVTEWGDKYKPRVELAKKAIKHFDGDSGILEFLKETGLGDDPRMIKFFHSVGKTLNEADFFKSETNTKKKKGKLSAANRLFPNSN